MRQTWKHLPMVRALRRLFKSILHSSSSRYFFVVLCLSLVSGCTSVRLTIVEITEHSDNFVVIETLKTDFGINRTRLMAVCNEFYRHYEDEFDVLVLMAHNPARILDQWGDGIRGKLDVVRNAEVGTGIKTRDFGRRYGSGDQLKGIVQLVHPDLILSGVLLHEIMHLWIGEIEVIPTVSKSHWGFSSVGGQLGGFKRDELNFLGDGRYSAGDFWPHVAIKSTPYSPLEMYLAGWLPPDEVPDVWVAEDGSWLIQGATEEERKNQRDEDGNKIFTANKISTWSIEQIIEKLGPRSPDFEDSQKEFRVAFVLVTDGRVPVRETEMSVLNLYIEQFTRQGPVSDWLLKQLQYEQRHNFWEATQGVATMHAGGLQSFRR